ncbi:MAG: single-stranded DNA-binding protein [Clostridia bacterium]|nr:single-stranded DNA-binding protein [Clostridia bacterium]
MNHELLENNKVYLQGKVVSEPIYSHEVFDEGFYNLNLLIPRLSGQEDIIPITISEKLLSTYNIKLNDVIALKGQFRSYNKIEDDKSRLVLTVFVREICEIDENQNPNVIEIFGYICKPPIYRTTPFNREITDVLMAVNRSYNKSDYIPCITWGRNARYVGELPVGTKLEIVGRIQSREYVKHIESNNEPIKKIAYEISISKVNSCE